MERLTSAVALFLLLCSCASAFSSGRRADRIRIEAAKAELAVVREGLFMYQAENDQSRFPATSSITCYDDLLRTLSPYCQLLEPQDAAWTYVSYVSAMPDTFVLLAKAKDGNRTAITVTPTVILP
jgi:hypothetical protein